MNVHVIGASGRSGTALCRALANDGATIIPVVRNPASWAATGLPQPARRADLTDPPALQSALNDATHIVSCAHARHAPAILAAATPGARFIFLGSTRKFTRWPDAHGSGVLAGEAAFLASGSTGVMLHPTMIYGAQGEDNVQRLAALLKKLPVVPLPDGGRALVQPIHQDDVTASIRAALALPWPGPDSLVIAGPVPLTYADFVRAVAFAAGLPTPKILPIPAVPLRLAAPLTAALPFLPRIRADEIRRLTEDKAFPIEAMVSRLGVTPRTLVQGLATLNISK